MNRGIWINQWKRLWMPYVLWSFLLKAYGIFSLTKVTFERRNQAGMMKWCQCQGDPELCIAHLEAHLDIDTGPTSPKWMSMALPAPGRDEIHMTTSPCPNQLPSRASRGERKSHFAKKCSCSVSSHHVLSSSTDSTSCSQSVRLQL